ncbi:MAG TPA: hypothetical protein VNV44_08510 [Solirubrobacteraceae bacterium]|jgi:hypothetical protein|nr:hypothetical protein [Solirubrobacteraceae bacterium]
MNGGRGLTRGAAARARGLAAAAVLAVSMLALLAAAPAGAAPIVHFKAEPVPIPGYPHTGFILGAGTALIAEYQISGTEYGGFPPPLINVSFYLPEGTQLHPSGFPTCPVATLEPSGPGPKKCPKGSAAGTGAATGYVAFGKEIVPETASIQAFYAPGGGLTFFTFGHEPVLLEILSKGHYVSAAAPFSKELESQVPLVETVPGAQDASVKSIHIEVGTATRNGGKPIFYGRLPRSCPKGFLPVKTALTFAGLDGLAQQTVTVEYKAPCPRR